MDGIFGHLDLSDPEALQIDSFVPEASSSAVRQVLPRLDEPCLHCGVHSH